MKKKKTQILADINMFVISHKSYEIRNKFDRTLLICGGRFHGCIQGTQTYGMAG